MLTCATSWTHAAEREGHLSTHTSAQLNQHATRARRKARTANLRGLIARSGRPMKNEMRKHTLAPAVQSRKPEKRSHLESAKYLIAPHATGQRTPLAP